MHLLDDDKILFGLVSLALAGWNMYLSSVRSRLEKDIESLKKWRDDYVKEADMKWTQVLREFVPLAEYSRFRDEIMSELRRIDNKLDRLIERQVSNPDRGEG